MKKWLRWLVVLGFLLIPAALLVLSSSDLGLRCLVALCNRLSAGRLTLNSASGSLLGSLQLQGVRYADSTDSVVIDTLTVRWDPTELLNQRLQIESIHTAGVRVVLGQSEQETIVPLPFSSPLNLLIEEITAEKITIISDQEEMMFIRTGTIRQLSFQRQILTVDDLSLSTEEATLRAKGQLQTTNGYPLQLALESLYHPAGFESFSGTGILHGPLNALELDVDFLTPFPVHLQGQINNLLGDLSWQARLEGKEVALRKIHKDWPDQFFSDVVIDGKGSLREYTLRLQSSAEAQQLKKPVALSAEIQGNLDGLRVDALHLVHEKASLLANGTLAWSPTFSWTAEVTGSHIDPSLVLTEWPGDFSCTINSTGRFIGNDLDASFYLPELQGTLRNFPLTGKGEVHLTGRQIQIPQLVVTSAGSTLKINGKATETVDLSLQLDSNNLAELWPNVRGKIHAQGRLTGSPAKPQIELKLTGVKVGRGRRDGVEKLAVETKGMLSRDGRLNVTVKAEQLQFGSTTLNLGQVQFQGSMDEHALTVEGRNSKLSAGFLLQGKVIGKTWQGRLSQTHLTSLRFGNWQQQQVTPFSFSPDTMEIKPLCLVSPTSGSICLNGSWLEASGTWQLHGTVSSLPLNFVKEAWDNPWPIEGQLNGAIDLTGQQSRILTGKLHGDSAGMVLHIPLTDGTEQRVKWRKNTLQVDYAHNQLQTVLDSELTDNSLLHMDVRVANLQLPGSDLMHTPVKGAVQLQMRDLSPLTVLTEQMVNLSGALQGQFTLNGTLAVPLVTGQMELANGQAEILSLGITLSPLLLTVKGDNNRVQLQATAHSGSGYLRAESTLNIAQADFSTNTIILTGEAFKAAHLPGLDLDVSPDLQVILGRKQTNIRGTVKIPKARITSIDFYNATVSSNDMIVVDDEQAIASPTSPLPLFTSVTVIAGDDVQIDAYGLQGAITGKLQVIEQPGRPQVGNGTLSVRNGSFTLYGKRLKIDLGRLLFTGGPLTNPGIELRSENKSNNVTTGVAIEGFLQHPEITFYSSPSMEQSAIISNLLENTAIGGETRKDTGFIGKAATKIGLGRMVPYLQSVKQFSMIDEIKLETGRDFDTPSLIFGSWLTPDFYVNYGKNLLTESGNFNTRYTLGKGFYFMTETGASQSGGDLKYEFER